MKFQKPIVENCKMIRRAPEEFVVQLGIGGIKNFYMFNLFSQRMYANCVESKLTLEVNGFKTLCIPEGCTVTTQNHVIQTSTKEVVGYDVEIETMELKFENLIDESTVDTKQLFKIVSRTADNG